MPPSWRSKSLATPAPVLALAPSNSPASRERKKALKASMAASSPRSRKASEEQRKSRSASQRSAKSRSCFVASGGGGTEGVAEVDGVLSLPSGTPAMSPARPAAVGARPSALPAGVGEMEAAKGSEAAAEPAAASTAAASSSGETGAQPTKVRMHKVSSANVGRRASSGRRHERIIACEPSSQPSGAGKSSARLASCSSPVP
mmetsp:Transcript_106512/g.306217  ORF Transcript_106512/g.306217 Transcript_106512/m.306217 type:complete len:202 (-) Transcript_106512:752-1357(-)